MGSVGKNVDGLLEKVSFKIVFEGISLIVRGNPFQT